MKQTLYKRTRYELSLINLESQRHQRVWLRLVLHFWRVFSKRNNCVGVRGTSRVVSLLNMHYNYGPYRDPMNRVWPDIFHCRHP